MKTKNRRDLSPPTASTCKLFMAISSSVICLSLSLLLAVTDPVLMIAKYRTRLAQGSAVYSLLQKEIDAIHLSTFLFNVTNADRFVAGKDDKLKVEEVGPFTYAEKRSVVDLELDTAAGVMRYRPQMNLSFVPEESVGDPKNFNVTMPNIPLLSMTSMVSYSFIMRAGFSLIVNRLNAKPIISLSAHDYLWGYEDPLISLGNTYLPGWIYFDTLGILDRMYDHKNNHMMEVGARDEDRFQIKSMGGLKGLRVWGYDIPSKRSKCNSFVDSYEGISYRTDMTSETRVRLFRPILCRFFEFEHIGYQPMEYGSDALVMQFKNDSYVMDKEKECLCSQGICMDGISDVSPCFYSLPLAISNAHFTGADPELMARVEGLNPDPEKFASRFLIEPKLGLALDTDFWVQLNVVVGDVRYSGAAARFANMVVPIATFRVTQPKMSQDAKDALVLMHTTAPRIVLALQISLLLAGLTLLAYSAWLLYWNWIYSNARGIAFQLPTEGKKESLDIGIELPLIKTHEG